MYGDNIITDFLFSAIDNSKKGLDCGHIQASASCPNCNKCIYCDSGHILTTEFNKEKTIIVCKNQTLYRS